MSNDDIEGIFKDFGNKVTGKKDIVRNVPKELSRETPRFSSKKSAEDELLEEKYQKEQELLEEKFEKEKELLEKKRKEEAKGKREAELRENVLRQKSVAGSPVKKSSGNTANIERIGYLAVIIVLVVYTVIDLSFYHGEKSVEAGKGKAAGYDTAAPNATLLNASLNTSKEQNKSNAANESKKEEKKEEPVAPAASDEKQLSGKIKLTLDNLAAEISKTVNDTGYINSVAFTIENGKDKALTPIVDVYAYDANLDVAWETKSRGQYKGTSIKPGEKYSGTLSLTPRTFSNLNIEKSVRLALNDTKDGFITSVNEKIIIS